MAILKCKICGGDMTLAPGKTFGICEYCGGTMTLPKIEEEQRGILATSRNAEHYDVFISYKELDKDGSRTRDSILAQDIYYQFTEMRKSYWQREINQLLQCSLEKQEGTKTHAQKAMSFVMRLPCVTPSPREIRTRWGDGRTAPWWLWGVTMPAVAKSPAGRTFLCRGK